MSGTMQDIHTQAGAFIQDFVAQTIDFYRHLKEQPVCRPAAAETLDRLAHQPIPREGRPLPAVYEEMQRDIYANTLLVQHPRSFSCIPSTASPLSWMGDVMTNAYNPHASCQINAPGAAVIERRLIRWMCDLAGYPAEAGGLFVSGGSIANLAALTAARDAKLAFEERPHAVVYVSDQTHYSVAKGLHIAGFDRHQIRTIPTDSHFRMDMRALREAVQEDAASGRKPFAVVASAGSTNTGSVDPLEAIAALCREQDMWMHVDGAFGASALLSRQHRKSLSGIEHSDSLSWDAHKWMLQTYGCSVVLVRSQSLLIDSFAAHPEYLKDAESTAGDVEFWDLGPELTRPARGLKLWLTLQTLGTDAMGHVIDHGCSLAELAEQLIRRQPDWEIVSPAQLGIVNFRYAPHGVPESGWDALNQAIAREVTESGFAQVFTTELRGKKVLRMCTIHPETTGQDIRDTVARLTGARAAGKGGNAPRMPYDCCFIPVANAHRSGK